MAKHQTKCCLNLEDVTRISETIIRGIQELEGGGHDLLGVSCVQSGRSHKGNYPRGSNWSIFPTTVSPRKSVKYRRTIADLKDVEGIIDMRDRVFCFPRGDHTDRKKKTTWWATKSLRRDSVWIISGWHAKRAPTGRSREWMELGTSRQLGGVLPRSVWISCASLL